MSSVLLALTVLLATLTGVEAAPEDRNAAFWNLLSAMIILMVLGMAATVDKVQAKAALTRWKAPLVGIFSQCIFMPFLAFLLGVIFNLSAVERVGLILVGCTPGGTTSQLFTYWSAGNVALSFLMTTCSTALALGWIPALIAIAVKPYVDEFNVERNAICMGLLKGAYFDSEVDAPVFGVTETQLATISEFKDKDFPNFNGSLPLYCWESQLTGSEWKCAKDYYGCAGAAGITKGMFANNTACFENSPYICGRDIQGNTGEVVKSLLAIVVCAMIGYFTREPCFGRSKTSAYHKCRLFCIRTINPWIVMVGNSTGILVIFVLIIWGSIDQPWIFTNLSWKILATCILIGGGGFAFGYFVSRFLGFNIRDARTISLETGIQNGPLAIIIVGAALPACAQGQAFSQCAQKQALLFPYIYSIFIVAQSLLVTTQVYMKQAVEPPPNIPDSNKSVIVGDDDNSGGAPRQNALVTLTDEHALLPELPGGETYDPTEKVETRKMTTLYDTFQRGVRLNGNSPCLGTRQETGLYTWITYKEMDGLVQSFGAGLSTLGGMKSEEYLGIMSCNRVEWVVAMVAAHHYNFVIVPLYDTLGEEALTHIVNQTELKIIVCAPALKDTLGKLADKCPSLEKIVAMSDSPWGSDGEGEGTAKSDPDLGGSTDLEAGEGSAKPESELETSAGTTIKTVTFKAVLDSGRSNPKKPTPPTTSDAVCMLCYTSGTTGMPKGAMLSHGNLVSGILGAIAGDNALKKKGQKGLLITSSDVHISFLPLAHVFEQYVIANLFCVGARAGFYGGNVKQLMDDITELRPTILVAVPRLLNRMRDKILARIQAQSGWVGNTCGTACPPPKLGRYLFRKGFASKRKNLHEKHMVEDGFWDSTVFSTVQQRLGSRVRLIITGSAPISSDVLDFLRVCFSCDVVEGYGQTECGAAMSVSYPRDTTTGNIGVPAPQCQIKLVDIPEMDYLTTDKPCPRGEICCKGPNVFLGYLNEQEKTDEAIDGDGWLHSGDVGRWNADGTLTIIDRKKNIFKLSQGEYIAPEKIEACAQSSNFVAQALVEGNSLKHQLVAVIVPDEDTLVAWAKESGIDFKQGSEVGVDDDGEVADWYHALCRAEETKQKIMDELDAAAKEGGLKGFEKVKNIYVEAKPFDADRGLLTPTFKPKRKELRIYYEKEIDTMYAVLEEGLQPAAEGKTSASTPSVSVERLEIETIAK
jgi:long-chain acyl-CoA synthetase